MGMSLFGVKLLNTDAVYFRTGSFSDIISGVNYVYNTYRNTGRPSVASMSLGGDAYTPLDNAVNNVRLLYQPP